VKKGEVAPFMRTAKETEGDAGHYPFDEGNLESKMGE
jgi:hypothetical protein